MTRSTSPNVSLRLLFSIALSLLLAFVLLPQVLSAPEGPLDEVTPVTTAANDAVTKAGEAAKETTKVKTKIEELSTKKKAEEASVRDLESLDKYLKEDGNDFLKKQKQADDNLATQKTKVQGLITKLEALPKSTEVDAAIKKLKDEPLKKVTDQITADTELMNGVKTAAGNVYKTIDAIAKELPKQIKALTDQGGDDAEVDTLLAQLSAQLTTLSSNIALRADFVKTWNSLEPELKAITATPAADPGPAITASKTAIDAIVDDKLPKWLKKLQTETTALNTKLLTMRIKLDKDVYANSVEALKLLEDTDKRQKALLAVAGAARSFALKIKNESVKTEAAALSEILNQTPKRISMVQAGLQGDFSDFVADFVPLYYFTDVFNLMKILNPQTHEIRDVSALRDEATTLRRQLDKADLELVDAQARLDELQTRVRDLEEQLEEAQRSFLAADDGLLRATRRREELESRPDKDQGQITRAKQREADAQKDKDSTEAVRNKLQDEKTGLPAQIDEAQKALITAQQNARAKRNQIIALAQMESEAFAAARDSEAVLFGPMDVTSKDPLQHVLIHAFSGRKVIHIRGRQEDVDKAKTIISLLDRPAPQARLNLWTLELNSTADKDGARHFNQSLELVEQELSNTRAQIAAILSLLRDEINEEVNSIALMKLNELEQAQIRAGWPVVGDHTFVTPNSVEDLRWARLFFYQKEVLMRLGFDPEKPAIASRNQSGVINRIALPDPAGTTTLGESLIVLTLANPASRYEILERFAQKIDEQMGKLGDPQNCEKDKNLKRVWFASMRRSLGADFKPYYEYRKLTEDDLRDGRNTPSEYYRPTYAYTAQQREIVSAISLAVVPRLIKRLIQLQKQYRNTGDSAARENIEREIGRVLSFLWDTQGLDLQHLFSNVKGDDVRALAQAGNNQTREKREEITDKVDEGISKLQEFAKRRNVLRTATAQVARADLMLRQIINAVDEDIDRHFVQPMMICLRERLTRDKGIGVGIVNRTSVLATNRLVARVDARSSAQLAIGDEQDALQAAQQLANLFLAAKTGGLLGGINGLNGLSQRSTSELYGLTSGSVFKVTPIFDPTGQTLRFKFDYVLANNVADPDGSINPQLPRIERHTVNTEVELNNFELREISRFNTNARLGIPTTRRGGIPIIKDIPGMKYVPLLGWFVRRSGQSAVIQQSLMMGQTTMYPTIADIFDLLSGDDYLWDGDELDCCKLKPPINPQDDVTVPEPVPPPDNDGAGDKPADKKPTPDQPKPPPVNPDLKSRKTKKLPRPRGSRTPPPMPSPSPTPSPTPRPSPTPTPTPKPSPTPTPTPRQSPSPNPDLKARQRP